MNVEDISSLVNARLFAEYAGNDIARWSKLIHSPLLHNDFGGGRLLHIEDTESKLTLFMSFDADSLEESRMFRPQAFKKNVFRIVVLPSNLDGIEFLRSELEEKILTEIKEAEDRRQAEQKAIEERLEAERRAEKKSS